MYVKCIKNTSCWLNWFQNWRLRAWSRSCTMPTTCWQQRKRVHSQSARRRWKPCTLLPLPPASCSSLAWRSRRWTVWPSACCSCLYHFFVKHFLLVMIFSLNLPCGCRIWAAVPVRLTGRQYPITNWLTGSSTSMWMQHFQPFWMHFPGLPFYTTVACLESLKSRAAPQFCSSLTTEFP